VNRRDLCLGAVASTMLAKTGNARAEPVELTEGAIRGRYHGAPTSGNIGVLVLGGSDGGAPSARACEDLAQAGFSTLGLAYFNGWSGRYEGLPTALVSIPIENIFAATEWLRREAGVSRVVLMGESRGAELALLAAACGAQVEGVIAFSPSHVLWPAPMMSMTEQQRSAWTRNGTPLPFVALQPAATPFDAFTEALDRGGEALTAARIDVASISKPVMLVSSRADAIWPADRMAQAIVAARGSAQTEHLVFD
jgi:uncharacterized protein